MNLDSTVVLLLPAAILGLVEVVKQWGLTGKVLTLVAMLIGTGLMIAAQLVEASSFKIVLYGILAGLSAAGLYDFSRLLGGNLNPKG